MKIIELKDVDLKLIDEIITLENDSFGGNGGVDAWMIKALVKYGKVFVLKNKNDGKDEIIAITEFMASIFEKKVFLYGICTSKKYQRSGYATKMMQHGEDYFKNMGFEYIELTVDPNNHFAVKFYEKIGYFNIKFLKDEYGEGIDRLLMSKKIK